MYKVIAKAKTTEGKKIIVHHTFKTKRECEFFIKGASEIAEVVDYSITKTK